MPDARFERIRPLVGTQNAKTGGRQTSGICRIKNGRATMSYEAQAVVPSAARLSIAQFREHND